MDKYLSVIPILFILSACGANVPIEKHVSSERLSAAARVIVYRKGSLQDVPLIKRTLGPVEGHSCQNKFWDSVSESAAIEQAKLRAVDLGANAILELRTEWSGTEFARNCWKSVTASGVAVVLAE